MGFRPVDTLPVTRYDFDIALVEAKERGKRIIKQKYRPFSSLAEKIAWYEFLPYMKWGMTEEIRYLARVAIDGIVRRGKPDLATEPREKLEKGETLISIGKWNEGLRLVVEAQEGSMNTFDSLV